MAQRNGNDPCSEVSIVKNLGAVTGKLDAVIVAAGFERRAYHVLPEGLFKEDAHCILVRFIGSVRENDELFEKFLTAASRKFDDRIHVVELHQAKLDQFGNGLTTVLEKLPKNVRVFGFDISGFPSHAICTALKIVRDQWPQERQHVLYTAAVEYNPNFERYKELVKRNPDEIELLPRSMALEMAENLVLDAFSGYRSQNAKSCLAIFAGFEAHRSTGIVEAVNPALLLLLYGNPGDRRLAWRLDLSRKLHRKFEKGRRTATEVVSTLHVKESLNVLERYYDYLIDDYDFVISPICSKMDVVSAYLFWERYPETQLAFPIPIGYDPKLAPKGVAQTYSITLEPRRGLFRSAERS